MKEKYLPIGTICILKGRNRKYMIVGFYSLEYLGNVKMYDYIAYPYPEGKLLESQAISFNHYDIINIDFMGYTTDEYNEFNRKLLEPSFKDNKAVTRDILKNIQFDENGVVIYEELSEYNSRKYNQNKDNDNTNVVKNISNNNYTFDANGIVQIDNSFENIENPFIKDFSKETSIKIENKEPQIINGLKFDSNGNVIEDNSTDFSNANNTHYENFETSSLELNEDEASLNSNNELDKPKYKFDENGMIIVG